MRVHTLLYFPKTFLMFLIPLTHAEKKNNCQEEIFLLLREVHANLE